MQFVRKRKYSIIFDTDTTIEERDDEITFTPGSGYIGAGNNSKHIQQPPPVKKQKLFHTNNNSNTMNISQQQYQQYQQQQQQRLQQQQKTSERGVSIIPNTSSNTTYVVREETMEDLLREGFKRLNQVYTPSQQIVLVNRPLPPDDEINTTLARDDTLVWLEEQRQARLRVLAHQRTKTVPIAQSSQVIVDSRSQVSLQQYPTSTIELSPKRNVTPPTFNQRVSPSKQFWQANFKDQ
jgi:hypothetical protein